MAIGKGSRVEFVGPGHVKMHGLVYKTTRNEAHVISDSGATLRGDPRAMRESDAPLPADHPSRRFVVGDRVEFEHPKEGALAGTVTRTDRFGFVAFATDDGRHFKDFSAARLKPSAKPAPKGVTVATSHAKGARVEFDDLGKTLYGVVTRTMRGGEKVEVTLDGGVEVMAGAAALFRPSTQPLKAGPSDAMDRWGVVSYKLHAKLSEETPCFEASVTLDGKKVIAASNRGTGGCDDFHALPGAPKDIVATFEADAKAWAARNDARAGEGGYREDASSWIDWSVNKKPFGVTAKDYFDDYNRSYDEMSRPAGPR